MITHHGTDMFVEMSRSIKNFLDNLENPNLRVDLQNDAFVFFKLFIHRSTVKNGVLPEDEEDYIRMIMFRATESVSPSNFEIGNSQL